MQEYNGTTYREDTPQKVIEVLESVMINNQRIRVFYGNTETGRSWLDEHDVMGYVGRSTGKIKIPLLIPKSNSYGGSAILDDCIVMITIDKAIAYKHEKFNIPSFSIKKTNEFKEVGLYYSVLQGNVSVANFETEKKAKSYIEFLQGKRNKIA